MPDSERYQQYEVLRRADGSLWELGRGAMGITYKAFDTNLRCPVALKVINSTYLQNETARQRFLHEARAAAALRHPNVASVFNLGTDQGNYFYVMEFIDGETVEALVKRKGHLEPIEALNVTQQVARALGAAAKRRLVHRDLKPSNLMLVDDEGESVVKVIDFGLAKSVKESTDESAALTMGGFVGTPHFASPEQVEEGEVDVRSDIYSLGATLYFMLTGKAPFSGSVGQVMSQHLYKPIAVEPLADVPQCVIALIQSMLEKDRTRRPQTPRALQDAIVSCLEEIRGESTRSIPEVGEAEPEVLTPGAILARQYRLIEEPGEILQGLHFIAEDLIRTRLVRLLVLRPDFVSDPHWFTLVQVAVERLRNAPHSMLRAIYSLETAGGRAILVEENIVGPSLQDVLRSRGILTASEAVRLASLLAPLADHGSANRLEYVDFSLLGIHFVAGDSETSQGQPDLLKQPLTDFEHLEPKVNGIDFSFTPPPATTLTDFGTQLQHGGGAGPRSSYVRSLGLLVYELLGGPRTRVETTGRYKPIAALTQEGNAVLRRGLVDEFSSATELARQLKAIVDPRKSAIPLRDGTRSQVAETDRISREHAESGAVGNESKEQPRATKDPAIQTSRPEIQSGIASTRTSTPSIPVLILAGVVSFCVGIIGYLIYLQLGPPPEEQSTKIPALSIQTDPPGAAILLDGKPPQSPNTFTQVPFGTHQFTATLPDYESIKQDIEVRKGMAPEIHLKLKPTQEIAALSIQTDPPGASILLDGKPPQSPNTFAHVPFGTHQLTATLNDYEPIKQDLVVQKGMAPELHLKLKPTQEIAALSIQTDPPGAAILLDGKAPQSPNTFAHVPFGTHQLTATLNDYEPIKQDLMVQKGMAPELHLKLKPTQEVASLSIQTDPPGAAILLDGKAPQSPNTFAHVPFGTHQLTATLNDYEPIKQDLVVQKGMAPELRLKLKPTQEIAALSIQTDPPGAAILLDGKAPQSPNTFAHVPFGTHQLTATLNDYEPIKQDLMVQKGMAPELRLKLKPTQEIAALSIQTDPPGAAILLDGKAPQSPNTFAHVPFGTHQLTATLNDYEPIKQDLVVQKGMAPELRLKLKPTQEIAALSIQTDPPGAAILLDGKAPQSPNTFAHVPFGTHQLTAALNDYEPIKQDLVVQKGMAPELRLKLKPTQEIAALSVQTDPSGASILLDGKPPQSPNTFAHVPFGTHQLTATLNDYEPIKQDIEVRRGMAPEIHLKLKPIQEIAALSVQTDPPGGSILLDGKPPQSPNTFTHVPFGTHQLTATLNDYEPIKQDLVVQKGMAPELHLKLKPTQEIAALSIQTDPPGAAILLDGKAPQSPNTFAHVPFGTHQLTATLNDYEPIKQDLVVQKGMAPELRLKLKPTQEIAALSIQTDPPGAAILLDGKAPQSPNTFAHVPFGTHQLTATLNDYEPIKQDLVVQKGMAPELHLKLKPTQEVASLSVQTDPPGASILLDGKSPQSPNTFTHVPFGTHQLTATLDKYDASNQEIQVAKGTPSEIHVTLKPKSSPLDALVAEVKKYGEGTPEQVTALVRLVQFCTSSKTPDAEEHTKELAEAIERLRTKTRPISKDEFSAAYKASIKDAADLNILPAILWLAENETGRESFDRFLRAANLGDSCAMMNVGKLYLYKATAADDVQAFSWLKRGYESAPPNLEAGAYLGFCYLHGRGTKKDENEGKKITLSLANQSVVFAMTNAGLLLAEEAQETREKASKGTTQIRRQLTAEADALEVQARQWWERAAEKNDWSASARLGQFYQAGLGGLTKSDEQAERLYQEGVKHGNTLSKYYYALFLIEKKPDRRSEAEDLMSQAATAGVQSARKWCEQNNAKLNKAVPDVEQQ